MKILTVKSDTVDSILRVIRGRRNKASVVTTIVRMIIENVKNNGDKAIFSLTKKFDGVDLSELTVSRSEVAEAYKKESRDFINSLKKAKANILKFQKSTIATDPIIETSPGVKVWREFRPIEKVGLYIPGGKAVYPSTVLMLGVPAQIAGCKEIILCVPPDKAGKVPSPVLVAADLCGIKKIFKVGGAQAIAAMAYGTESIPKVSKIFGPGNEYVTAAKMMVYGEVDIDMPAGPSEVLVYADETANPSWVAADLLSQLEHSATSQAILVTKSRSIVAKVQNEIKKQTRLLTRQKIVQQALKNSFVVLCRDSRVAVDFINAYAPEHLEIISKKESQVLADINNAGSVFLGPYSSEPIGDYASGSNHTLPTSGYAKMFSALSAESFGKKMQIQKINKKGFRNLKSTVESLADREGFDAHSQAIRIRYQK